MRAEKRYRDWLIDFVNVIEDRDYKPLLTELYNIKFYSLIDYDDDRGADGMALRDIWADNFGYSGPLNWDVCSVLEVIVGVAIRIEFQNFGGPFAIDWPVERVFWDLMNNLGLLDMDGPLDVTESVTIRDIIDIFLSRNYKRHKKGNIFIIFDSNKDLSKIAIWDQMHLYIREKWPKTPFLE